MTALRTRDWLGKGSAGLILGFLLALAVTGLFLRLTPAGGAGKAQLTMWLMGPIWAFSFSLVFLFRTPARAWSALGAATAVMFLLFGLTSL